MDGNSSSPEPYSGSPPQNTSTPARNVCSDGGSGSDESIRDEESAEHSEDDLDEFFKNAEGLSDQTFGDMRLYDCSLSTDVEKSLSHSNHHTFNECSTSNLRHFHDLSCSMLADAEKSLQYWKEKSEEIACRNGPISGTEHSDARNAFAELLHAELIKAHQENEDLKVLNKNLSAELEEQHEYIVKSSASLMNYIPKVRSANEGMKLANLSVCSLEQRHDYSPNTTADSFRLSSYIRQLDDTKCDAEIVPENRSCQTSPHLTVPFQLNNNANNDMFSALSKDMQTVKVEWCVLKKITKQELCERSKEIKDIVNNVQLILRGYDDELSTSKHQRVSDQKHYQEVINNLKDDIKTMKMRNQEMMKHKDQEIRELKSRLPEPDEKADNFLEKNLLTNTDVHTFDDSFNSCNSNIEETFTNLTRTKVEYLKLTPSEYVDDEVVDTVVSIPDSVRHILEDKDLKFRDLEKKFESNKRYLEDLTHDRELERDEFQQLCDEHQVQIEELRKENAKFMEEKKQMMYQIEELTTRLQNAEENEMEIAQKWEKSDNELKAAVEKIFELREIVREQEMRLDDMTQCVAQLEEEKQVLRDELEKQELLSKKEQPVYKEQDTYGTLPLDVTDEIHHQLQDLVRRIEGKVIDMDSFQMHPRPSSSCSGVTSAVSTEDISCREAAGRTSRNFENCTLEHMGSAIFNEIHRLESHFENIIRYDDVFIKKLKDADLHSTCQKTKIEELETQITIYQEKCSKQTLQIADLEGKIDTLRFEPPNQNLVSSLQSRLGVASKQLDDFKALLAIKEKELIQVKAELNMIKTAQFEKQMKKLEACTQTDILFEESMSHQNLAFEGVSPEKIRRMDTVNHLSTSVISLSRSLGKDGPAISLEPEISILDNFQEQGRSGRGASFRKDDSCGNESAGDTTIKEMDENLQQLQQLLLEKDKQIQILKRKLESGAQMQDPSQIMEAGIKSNDKNQKKVGKCEEEFVTLDTELNPNYIPKALRSQGQSIGSDGDSSTYEISYSHDYEVDGDLLKYLGTKLLYQGPKSDVGDQGQIRVLETDRQIEIATLNTHILQLKRALEDEKKKSENLLKRLRSCEEEKAALRSRGPAGHTSAPVRNVTSSASVQQMQQKELVRQIDEGRKQMKEKEKEIRSLKGRIVELETTITGKDKHEQELLIRLNSTIAMLKRCEDHGRELTSCNQEQVHEIRRLRTQLDRSNVNHNNENSSQSASGNEYFENFMRAKSHRKALAWQKKYLSSVILGYKSILRQNGHGSEHPDLLQAQVPIAPGAVGYLDIQRPKTRFRIGVLTVIATIRMKYMVSRWCKKRPGESSPDSEYKASRHSSRVDSSIIRPKRAILMHSRVNTAHPPLTVDNNINTHESRRGNLGDISEYLSRFASLENEISSSLSRNMRPSK